MRPYPAVVLHSNLKSTVSSSQLSFVLHPPSTDPSCSLALSHTMSIDPSQAAPLNPGDLGRGPVIMGVTWALTGVSLIIVSTRVYFRWKRPRTLAWDDAFIVAAMVR